MDQNNFLTLKIHYIQWPLPPISIHFVLKTFPLTLLPKSISEMNDKLKCSTRGSLVTSEKRSSFPKNDRSPPKRTRKYKIANCIEVFLLCFAENRLKLSAKYRSCGLITLSVEFYEGNSRDHWVIHGVFLWNN